jgi:hypothetical protein
MAADKRKTIPNPSIGARGAAKAWTIVAAGSDDTGS